MFSPPKPKCTKTPLSSDKAAAYLAGGAYMLVRESERCEERQVCEPEGEKVARTLLADFPNAPIADDDRFLHNHRGQASVPSVLFLVGLIVSAIWGWNHLDFDTQDFIIDEVVPLVFLGFAVCLLLWVSVRKVQRGKHRRKTSERLMEQFQKEKSLRKRFDFTVEMIELNDYKKEGLEDLAPEMADVLIKTFKTSRGDKQHRIRGMAASHMGVLLHQESIPLLIRALEDDHAYVRSSAALALGRMRALEAKEKLEYTMKEDWDQTVRSRSREAVERMSNL